MSGGMKITGGGHPEAGGIVRIIQEHPVESAITGLSLGALACGMQGLVTPTVAPTEAPINPNTAPIRLTRIDPSKSPEAVRTQIKDQFGQDVSDYYSFAAEKKGIEGFNIDADQKNAEKIGFDIYTLSNGETVGVFMGDNGEVNIGKVSATTDIFTNEKYPEIYGHVYQRLFVEDKNDGNGEQAKPLLFLAIDYGKIEGDPLKQTKDVNNQQAAARIDASMVEQLIIGNPFLQKEANVIVWERNGGQEKFEAGWADTFKELFDFGVKEVHALGEEETPTAVGTPSATVEAPGLPIAESVKTTMANDAEYGEMTKSLENGGQVTGIDHATGGKYEATVNLETVSATSTADWHYKTIVKAEATDKTTKEKYNVIWNPDTNTWVKEINLNQDSKDKVENYTYIANIDEAVASGDIDLMILSQVKNPFSESTPDPLYWAANGGLNVEDTPGNYKYHYFQYLSFFPVNTGMNPGWEAGKFDADNPPFKSVVFLRGQTKDGKWVISHPTMLKNKGGNVIEHLTMDFQNYYDFGDDYFYQVIDNINDNTYGVPVFPLPSDMADWIPDSTLYGIQGSGLYMPDVGAMQTPGEFFSALPADVQAKIRADIQAGGITPLQKSNLLPNGITPEIAQVLSRNLLYRAFETIKF